MSELDDALNESWNVREDGFSLYVDDDTTWITDEIVVEAARRLANLDIEAAVVVARAFSQDVIAAADGEIVEGSTREFVIDVLTALGITTEDDE